MNEKVPVLVVAAHPDDWQMFAGAAIYGHLQNPSERVTVVMLTAGDAGDDEYHWKSRHSGAVSSILRAMPSWSPYALGPFRAPAVPCGVSVSYDCVSFGGKPILHTSLRDTSGTGARMYSLHLRDGGTSGSGFPPKHESLSTLRAGASALGALWPEDDSVRYASWAELRRVVAEIASAVIGEYPGAVRIYAPDPDPRRNPGDHPDHACTGALVEELRLERPELSPVWMTMYDTGNRGENLTTPDAHWKRAAIHAYGGGYMAQAAGARDDWRRGWEREYPVFGGREYLTGEA